MRLTTATPFSSTSLANVSIQSTAGTMSNAARETSTNKTGTIVGHGESNSPESPTLVRGRRISGTM
jgi:hypothetical protein